MAFKHFHKHYRKYIAFSFAATLFSLFTFNITGALQAFTGSQIGRQGNAYIRFKTRAGREANVSINEWSQLQREMPGFLRLTERTGEPFYSWIDPRVVGEREADREVPLVHAILLAEADDLGIQIPREKAEEHLDNLLKLLQARGQELTERDLREFFAQFGLTSDRYLVRMQEALRAQLYVNTMQGRDVYNPEELYDLFAAENEKVGLEYVAFPFEQARDELKQKPPADEELETWFKALPADVVRNKYTREERFSFDLALVDGDAFDASKLPPELQPKSPDLTDEEILADVKRDPLRLTGKPAPPADVKELTDAMRANVKRERQVKALLEAARGEFEAAIQALPKPEPDSKPEERLATARAAFAAMALRFQLAPQSVADKEAKEVGDVDPPKDSALIHNLRGLLTLDQAPGLLTQHAAAVLPARDRKTGYVVFLVEKKPSEPKPFAEVKGQALDQWLDEHAKDRAEETAKKFRSDIQAEALKAAPQEPLAALLAAKEKAFADLEANAKLDAKAKKAKREDLESEWLHHLRSALGVAEGACFTQLAQSQHLEIKTIAPERRSIGIAPYFKDRFKGAEKFLLDADERSVRGAHLLGAAVGTVSEALVDEEGKACYVARIASRDRPKIEEMAPHDRVTAEREEEFVLAQRRFVSYTNPFSFPSLLKSHQPQELEVHLRGGGSPAGYPGY